MIAKSCRRLAEGTFLYGWLDEVNDCINTTLTLSLKGVRNPNAAYDSLVDVAGRTKHLIALDAFADELAAIFFRDASKKSPIFVASPDVKPFAGVKAWFYFGGEAGNRHRRG